MENSTEERMQLKTMNAIENRVIHKNKKWLGGKSMKMRGSWKN